MKIINCNKTEFNNREINDICSRHILVFGDDIQKILSGLTIGVVSVGGLGSVLIELLMRLFPGKLIFIDNDYVETSNLNRLINSRPIDLKQNTKKVDLVKRSIHEFNPNQDILSIHGDFLEKENQDKFRECDFLFGASDSNAVRIASNRLCLAHGITYLDCGVGANVKNGKLESAGGQVITILPNSGFCLHCSGFFNVTEAMNELLPFDERKRLEEQGYIRGINVVAPQVYSLNMSIASQAVWLFMRMVSGEEINFDGIAIDARNFRTHVWKETVKSENDCVTCGKDGIVFAGDDVDLLCGEEIERELL
ncbi:MAG: ThiF family adenylyltransferase [candidate division Zixibacteria bacterium]|nr:ThiF family adenylyltransferase [candidate division Zixibacteria bacterium]